MRIIIALTTQAYSLVACLILFRWLQSHTTHPTLAYLVILFELFVSFEIWSSVRRVRRRNAV